MYHLLDAVVEVEDLSYVYRRATCVHLTTARRVTATARLASSRVGRRRRRDGAQKCLVVSVWGSSVPPNPPPPGRGTERDSGTICSPTRRECTPGNAQSRPTACIGVCFLQPLRDRRRKKSVRLALARNLSLCGTCFLSSSLFHAQGLQVVGFKGPSTVHKSRVKG